MMKRILMILASGALLAFHAGCAGDPVVKMIENPDTQARLIDLMVADTTISQTLAQRLLGSTDSRTMLMDQALADGAFSQELMLRISRDPAFLNGAIGLGMQDPAMKDQLMTLFKGMQMVQ